MTPDLLLTIATASLLSTMLYVILKFFQAWKINNLHGLTFNYISAAILSFLYDFQGNLAILDQASGFIHAAAMIGLLFIIVFYITALTAQKSGIAVTSIAGKMSMVIPIVAGIYLYNDAVYIRKVTGIMIALAAVVLSSLKSSEKKEDQSANKGILIWLLPILLFTGSGLVDTSIKISQHYFITERNQGLYISFLFGSAGIIGLLLSVYQIIKNKLKIELKSIAGGILLGITNFYSLEFLIKALAHPGAESSIIFAISNVMVVLMSAIFAILIFKERLSKLNIAGLSLSIISIYLLTL
jgi:drug/metabolite transporter (DMT)-like permease